MTAISSQSNDIEKTKAWNEQRKATETLALIYALPQEVGARIQWENGVIWERLGDNAWGFVRSRSTWGDTARADDPYPSNHIARGTWKRVN